MNNKINVFITLCTIISMMSITSCKKDDPESRSYSFTITSDGSSLESASVSISTNGQNFSASTDNSGKCKIEISNDIILPLYTVVTIDHSSIKPYCLTVSGEENATSSTPINCTEVPSIVRLRATALYHLGNDLFDGSANSQLQLSSDGLEKSFSYTLPATPGIMPKIQIYARGIQHPLEIYSNGTQTGTLNNSASNGDLSSYDFQLSGDASTIFHAGSNVLTIKAGASGLSNDPWDDIEFCGVLLYY